MAKPKLATTSLAGCFGCHMSILDIDERILQLVELVDFDKSPVDDLKEFTGPCAVGLVEGGCANEENVRVLQDFRRPLVSAPELFLVIRRQGFDDVPLLVDFPAEIVLDLYHDLKHFPVGKDLADFKAHQ